MKFKMRLLVLLMTPYCADAADFVELHDPERFTCVELRQIVREHKKVLLFEKAKFAPVITYTFVYPKQCPGNAALSRPHVVKALDLENCVVGLRCAQDK